MPPTPPQIQQGFKSPGKIGLLDTEFFIYFLGYLSLVKTKTVVEILSLLPCSGNATTISLFCAFFKHFC